MCANRSCPSRQRQEEKRSSEANETLVYAPKTPEKSAFSEANIALRAELEDASIGVEAEQWKLRELKLSELVGRAVSAEASLDDIAKALNQGNRKDALISLISFKQASLFTSSSGICAVKSSSSLGSPHKSLETRFGVQVSTQIRGSRGATKGVCRGIYHPEGRDRNPENCAILVVLRSIREKEERKWTEREYNVLKALHAKGELEEQVLVDCMGNSILGEIDRSCHKFLFCTPGSGTSCKNHIIKPIWFGELWIAGGVTGDADLRPCLVEELVSPAGFNLRELSIRYTNAGQIIPEMSVKFIMRQLGRGLAHMHHHGVIHRDLKPENVMVGEDRQLKIIDFGHARAEGLLKDVFDNMASNDPDRFDEDLIKDRDAPSNKDLKDRTWYVAPECIPGNPSDGDKEADLWGVGVILHFMLTGGTYIEGKNQLVRVCDADLVDYRTHSSQATLDHFDWGNHPLMNLLKEKPSARWSLKDLYTWASRGSDPTFQEPGSSKIYHFSEWAPNVFLFQVKGRCPKKFEQKKLMDMPEFSQCGSVVLGVRHPSGKMEDLPGATTPIEEGAQIYFGLAKHKEMKSKLMNLLSTNHDLVTTTQDIRTEFERDPKGKGGLLGPFDLKCDAFDFPKWTYGRVVGHLSQGTKQPLNLRHNFQMNLAGIVEDGGKGDIRWWPDITNEITEGCQGLVARLPDSGGIAGQTLTLAMVKRLHEFDPNSS